MGHDSLLSARPWPVFDEALAREEEATVVVQVNGKLRGSLMLPRGLSEKEIFDLASKDEKIEKHYHDKQVVKIIFVPDKLINIVVKG